MTITKDLLETDSQWGKVIKHNNNIKCQSHIHQQNFNLKVQCNLHEHHTKLNVYS